jgi:3-oxoacyl-[acyl-carrier protein] reductase
MDLKLAGRAAIVTGASRGIGAAVAEQFAIEGVDVALLARSAGVHEVAERIAAGHGVNAFGIRADLSGGDQVEAAIRQAADGLGRVDILVNNAGASPQGAFDEVDDATWQSNFDLKFLGYVRCIRAVLPLMRQQGSGRIVNVVGMAGRYATPGYVLGAFNAGLLHLTKALAQDLSGAGITLVAVSPTLVLTERLTALLKARSNQQSKDLEAYRAELLASVPMRRFATPDEIARLIVMMSSDIASYVNGGALQADGAASTGVF